VHFSAPRSRSGRARSALQETDGLTRAAPADGRYRAKRSPALAVPRDLNRREALARIRRLLHTGAYADLRSAASAGSEDASPPTRPAPLPRLPLLGKSRSPFRPCSG
jgi:hypothetical protein